MSTADQLARKIADHLRNGEGTGAAWNIEIEEAREGYARVAMIVRADMLNGHKTCHGGMIFSLYIGQVLERLGSYGLIFAVAGAVYFIALLIIQLLSPRLAEAKVAEA